MTALLARAQSPRGEDGVSPPLAELSLPPAPSSPALGSSPQRV